LTHIAKVRFPSPLPQLDKEFDYLVPVDLHNQVELGSSVKVPFGPGGKLKLGFVTALAMESEHSDKLLSVEGIESASPVITQNQLELCLAVAKRQAGTMGELLGTAVPKFSARAAKNFYAGSLQENAPEIETASSPLAKFVELNRRVYLKPELVCDEDDPKSWANTFAVLCIAEYQKGRSSLVVLADFSDMELFEEALGRLNGKSIANRHSSSDSGSIRYTNHLKSIRDVAINYGVRSASFAPATNLGLILLWNDGDDSHTEQSSPYWNSREVLLQRAELEQSKLVIGSYSPSAEVIRLLEMEFLAKYFSPTSALEVRVSKSNERLDAQSFALISNALKEGKSVLVQIANSGWASSLACVGCKEIRRCPNCDSSIWIDPAGKFRCRNCKAYEALQPCTCGKIGTRPTRLGASAIAAQLAKSFPNATVVNSNGDNRVTKVQGSGILAVATPGAEPIATGGYAVVLLADAANMIGAPRLRALEQSLARWSAAISLANSEAKIIFVGIKDKLAQQMEVLDFYSAVRDDYLDRLELGLPPATRIASITVSNDRDFLALVQRVEAETDSELIRKLPIDAKNVLVLDYPYNLGARLADSLKALTTEMTSKSKSKRPGERVFRINMDDSKVI